METRVLNSGRRAWILGMALFFAGLPVSGEAPSAGGVDEFRAKAAFLYNFCKFVVWPENARPRQEQPFVIGVVGRPEMAQVMAKELTGKRMGGSPVLVRHLRELRDAEGVQVVYCTVAALRELTSARRRRLERSGVMTVGTGEGFLEAGGVLQVEVVKEHLAFEINVGASRRSGLEMSANLLGLALAVVDR